MEPSPSIEVLISISLTMKVKHLFMFIGYQKVAELFAQYWPILYWPILGHLTFTSLVQSSSIYYGYKPFIIHVLQIYTLNILMACIFIVLMKVFDKENLLTSKCD